MLDKYLIEQCSPTLASIKSASLFSYHYDDAEDLKLLKAYIREWNNSNLKKDIRLLLLKISNGFALIYVYRPKMLAKDLQKIGVSVFLKLYGYSSINIDYALSRLMSRIKDYDEFPHEIGLFLGYPLEDVKGFIENEGANSLHTGCWKVYCNKGETLKIFARYKKCRDVYISLWQSGSRSLGQLTVAS